MFATASTILQLALALLMSLQTNTAVTNTQRQQAITVANQAIQLANQTLSQNATSVTPTLTQPVSTLTNATTTPTTTMAATVSSAGNALVCEHAAPPANCSYVVSTTNACGVLLVCGPPIVTIPPPATSTTPVVLSSQVVIPGYDIYSPTVLFDAQAGYYKMWFGGWVNQSDRPYDKIYYATSTDQIHWSTPIKVLSSTTAINNDPSVVKLSNGSYVMFYTSLAYNGGPWIYDSLQSADPNCQNPNRPYNITYVATSADGINWQNPHQAIGQNNGLTTCGSWSPSAVLNGNQYNIYYHDEYATYVLLSVLDSNFNLLSTQKVTSDGVWRTNVDVVQAGGSWQMFYNAANNYPGTTVQGINSIERMTSADGIHWDTANPILLVPPQSDAADSAILTPFAMLDANNPNTFDLYFGAGNQSGAGGQYTSEIKMWRISLASAAAPVPVITSFSASSSTVNPGQSATLSWNVTGATNIAIDNGVGDVTNLSSVTVSPSQTTTYTLTASNAAGSVTASIPITVSVPTPVASIRVGQLVQKPGEASGAIYVVAETGLYWFPTPANFNGWGLSMANVEPANSSESQLPTLGLVPDKLPCFNYPLDQIRSGATACSNTMIRVGQTVNNIPGTVGGAIYLVGENQLYWFPDYTNFTNWGYSTATTVPVNAAESQLPQGPNVPDKLPCFQNPLDQIESGMTACPS